MSEETEMPDFVASQIAQCRGATFYGPTSANAAIRWLADAVERLTRERDAMQSAIDAAIQSTTPGAEHA